MDQIVPRDIYLAHARSFKKSEQEFIFLFEEWLPETIINCHAHCNLLEHVLEISEQAYRHMLSTFPYFSLEESREWQKLFHPTKTIRTLRFPSVFRGVDHKVANLYLLKHSLSEDRVALYGLPDDKSYTINMLTHPRVSALKMYFSYIDPPATQIYQYFPKEVLEVAEKRDIPIILHPPMRITRCLDQILQIVKDFPRLRICLAHLSLTKSVVSGLEEAFTAIAQYPQVSFDTALVPSAEVVAMAL
ncbi:MAG: amidohydrolase family protein, partial [Patescibacteria group bacterium]